MDALSDFLREAESLEIRLRSWLEREDFETTELSEFQTLLKEQHAEAQRLNSFHNLPVLLRKIHNVKKLRGPGSGYLERDMMLGLYYGICDSDGSIQNTSNPPVVVIKSGNSEVNMPEDRLDSLAEDAPSGKESRCQSRCSSVISNTSMAGESTNGAACALKGDMSENSSLNSRCLTYQVASEAGDNLQQDRTKEVDLHLFGLKRKNEGVHKTNLKRKKRALKQPEISDSDNDDSAKSHWSHKGNYAESKINPEKCEQCTKAGHLCRVWDISRTVRRRSCRRCTRKRISCGRAKREARQETGTQIGPEDLEYDVPSSPESAMVDEEDLHRISDDEAVTSATKKDTMWTLEHEVGSHDSLSDVADTSMCTVTGYDCTAGNAIEQIKKSVETNDVTAPIEPLTLFQRTRSITSQFPSGKVRKSIDTKDIVDSTDISSPASNQSGLLELVSSHKMLADQVVQLSAKVEEILTKVPSFGDRLADMEISNDEFSRRLSVVQTSVERGAQSTDRLSIKLENIFPANIFGDASIVDHLDGIKRANEQFSFNLSRIHSGIDRAIQHMDKLGDKLETSIDAGTAKNAPILSLLNKIEQSNETLTSQISSIHSQANRDNHWGLAINNVISNLVPTDPSRHPTIWAQLSEVESNIVESAANVSLSMSNLESKLTTIEELTTTLLSHPLLLESHVIGGVRNTDYVSYGRMGSGSDAILSNQSQTSMMSDQSRCFEFHDWKDSSAAARVGCNMGINGDNDRSWMQPHELRTDAVKCAPRVDGLDGISLPPLPGRSSYMAGGVGTPSITTSSQSQGPIQRNRTS